MESLDVTVFWITMIVSLAAAALVVTRKNPIYSAVFMALFFIMTAVNFLILRAPFLAVIQVLVYAGAIMVLYLFVIMLLNLKPDELKEKVSRRRKIVSLATSVALFCLIAGAVRNSEKVAGAPGLSSGELPNNSSAAALEAGEIGSIATELFMEHGLAFELTSVLILIAIIGAIYLTKKRPSAKHGITKP